MLRSDVRAHAWRTDHARDRGGVDNGACSLLEHDGNDIAQAQEDTSNVYGHDLVENVHIELDDRGYPPFNARVVEKAIDSTKASDSCAHVVLDIGRLCYVRPDGNGRAAC